MRQRITKIGVTLAALAALAVGGSALASAAQKSPKAPPPAQPAPASPTASQPGDASAPDSSTETPGAAPDGDNVQQGDQTGSDPAGPQTEAQASESGPSDGPGGYADTNPNADTQQQGEH